MTASMLIMLVEGTKNTSHKHKIEARTVVKNTKDTKKGPWGPYFG